MDKGCCNSVMGSSDNWCSFWVVTPIYTHVRVHVNYSLLIGDNCLRTLGVVFHVLSLLKLHK